MDLQRPLPEIPPTKAALTLEILNDGKKMTATFQKCITIMKSKIGGKNGYNISEHKDGTWSCPQSEDNQKQPLQDFALFAAKEAVEKRQINMVFRDGVNDAAESLGVQSLFKRVNGKAPEKKLGYFPTYAVEQIQRMRGEVEFLADILHEIKAANRKVGREPSEVWQGGKFVVPEYIRWSSEQLTKFLEAEKQNVSRTDASLKSMRQENQELKDRVGGLEKKNKELQEQSDRLKAEIDSLTAEKNKPQPTGQHAIIQSPSCLVANDSIMSDVDQPITESSTKLGAHLELITQLRDTLESITSQSQAKDNRIVELEHLMIEKSSEMSRLSEEYQNLKLHHNDLETKIGPAENEYQTLLNAKLEVDDLAKSYLQHISDLESQVSTQRSKAQLFAQKIEILETNKSTTKNLITEKTKAQYALKELAEKANKSLEEQKATILDLQNKLECLEKNDNNVLLQTSIESALRDAVSAGFSLPFTYDKLEYIRLLGRLIKQQSQDTASLRRSNDELSIQIKEQSDTISSDKIEINELKDSMNESEQVNLSTLLSLRKAALELRLVASYEEIQHFSTWRFIKRFRDHGSRRLLDVLTLQKENNRLIEDAKICRDKMSVMYNLQEKSQNLEKENADLMKDNSDLKQWIRSATEKLGACQNLPKKSINSLIEEEIVAIKTGVRPKRESDTIGQERVDEDHILNLGGLRSDISGLESRMAADESEAEDAPDETVHKQKNTQSNRKSMSKSATLQRRFDSIQKQVCMKNDLADNSQSAKHPAKSRCAKPRTALMELLNAPDITPPTLGTRRFIQAGRDLAADGSSVTIVVSASNKPPGDSKDRSTHSGEQLVNASKSDDKTTTEVFQFFSPTVLKNLFVLVCGCVLGFGLAWMLGINMPK